MKIGIPRAINYYYYYPFYKAFLETLGAEVVLSNSTSRKTLDTLADCPTDEPCIPIKILFPHTRELIQKGVDAIFLPVLSCGHPGSFYCPKHTGLPFMVKNAFNLSDEFLLSPTVDRRRHLCGDKADFVKLARKISRAALHRATSAFHRAELAQQQFIRLTCMHQVTTPEAFCLLEGENTATQQRITLQHPQGQEDTGLRIGIGAHSYTLYDYIGQNLVQRLREYGKVLTPEMVWPQDAHRAVKSIDDGARLWNFEIQIVGSALYWLQSGSVDCLVLLYPFECGPSAIIESFLEKEADKRGIPLLLLTVDEHTGEAGLVTRLEAFMDTAVRRRDSDQGIVKGAAPPYADTKEKKVLGMPSMGHLNLALESMFKELGIEMITPPITGKTIELGLELAPEFICYPLVVTIGQMRQALEAGATTILMIGGKGRCRLGWYSQVQENLLRKAGYAFEMITIDALFPLREYLPRFMRALAAIPVRQQPWFHTAGSIWRAYQKALLLDRATQDLFYLRAVEKDRGSADGAFSTLLQGVRRAAGRREIEGCMDAFNKLTGNLRRDEGEPYRIRIVGEIYVILEEFVNMALAKVLGNLPERRVWVDREICATSWFRYHILKGPTAKRRHHQITQAASPYISELIGGHGLESVGLTALAREEGMEGVIHLFPFTCMPEIVAQNIMTKVAQDFDLPLLTLIINEQTGEAGTLTRVEAFLDILEQRRRLKREERGMSKDVLLPGH